MKIEFFTDSECAHNVRFCGDRHANNEAILSVFYEFYSISHLEESIEEMNRVLSGELSEYELGDGVDIEVDNGYSILRADNVQSKIYKVKTVDLKKALQKWVAFKKKYEPNISETIYLKAEVSM